MRALSLIFLTFALALPVGGCDGGVTGDRGGAREGGSVLVGLARAPDSLDPALARSPEATQALWLAYTPLMTYRRADGAQGTEVVPGLAESRPEELDEATAFRFRLRKDLTYSDGRQVRAADFERAVARSVLLNPRARAALGGIRGVTGYEAGSGPRRRIPGIESDERTRTIRVELTRPDPDFPEMLTAVWTAPVPAGTAARDLSRTPPPGVGPYRLEGRSRGRSYVLTRRRDFRLAGVPAGRVDSVAGTVVRDRDRRTSQTLQGVLDVAQGAPPVDRLPRIRSEFKSRYREFATLTSRYVAFDLDSAPFADEDVRRAVSYALDLRALARLEDGFLSPSCNAIPSLVPGHAELDPCPYGARQGNPDLVRAESLVRRSSDRDRRVLVDGGAGPYSRALADYGVQTLRKIGLRARRATTPAQRRRAQMRFAATTPPRPTPKPYLEAVDDPGVAAEAAEVAQQESDQRSGWSALDRKVVEQALIAPFGLATTGVLMSERLDAANCLRFQPTVGLDLSSLCLR